MAGSESDAVAEPTAARAPGTATSLAAPQAGGPVIGSCAHVRQALQGLAVTLAEARALEEDLVRESIEAFYDVASRG